MPEWVSQTPRIRGGMRSLGSLLLVVPLLFLPSACATSRHATVSRVTTPTGWPLDSEYRTISSSFGVRASSGGGGQRQHHGIDIPAPKGTPIYATADGECIYSDYNRGGYGQSVIVQHDAPYQTLYAHMSKRYAKEGRWVQRGDVLGLVGSTGRATGNHLHYEIRRNGTAIDPRPFMGK